MMASNSRFQTICSDSELADNKFVFFFVIFSENRDIFTNIFPYTSAIQTLFSSRVVRGDTNIYPSDVGVTERAELSNCLET